MDDNDLKAFLDTHGVAAEVIRPAVDALLRITPAEIVRITGAETVDVVVEG